MEQLLISRRQLLINYTAPSLSTAPNMNLKLSNISEMNFDGLQNFWLGFDTEFLQNIHPTSDLDMESFEYDTSDVDIAASNCLFNCYRNCFNSNRGIKLKKSDLKKKKSSCWCGGGRSKKLSNENSKKLSNVKSKTLAEVESKRGLQAINADNIYRNIIFCLKIEGFWEYNDILRIIPDFKNVPKDFINCENSDKILSTIYAICILQKKYADKMYDWTLIVRKCFRWLTSKNINFMLFWRKGF